MALIQTEWWGRGPFSFSLEKDTFAWKKWEKIFLIYLCCLLLKVWIFGSVTSRYEFFSIEIGNVVCEREHSEFMETTHIIRLKGSPTIRNGGGKSTFWTPSWLFLRSWTCGFSVFYVKEASCLISSSSATFTLSSFSSSMTSLISSSTCPILTFYTFLESPDQMLAIDEEKRGWGKE